jgi:hypothetical protein
MLLGHEVPKRKQFNYFIGVSPTLKRYYLTLAENGGKADQF